MNSRTTADFRFQFANRPKQVQQQAREAYRLFAMDASHPSLKFKKLPPHEDIWSVRINNNYRAIGRRNDEIVLWFFIGSHADYDKLINRM